MKATHAAVSVFMLISVLFSSCGRKEKTGDDVISRKCSFVQELSVDAFDIMYSRLMPSADVQRLYDLKKNFSRLNKEKLPPDTVHKYFEVLTSIRDTSLTSVLVRLLDEDPHPYLTCQLLYTLSQTGGNKSREAVIPLLTHPNDLIRQYAVNAAGFLFNRADTVLLDSLLRNEANCYVNETNLCAGERIRGNHPDPDLPALPCDTAFGFKTYGIEKNDQCVHRAQTISVARPRIPVETEFVYPHQQYKKMSDRDHYHKISYGTVISDGSIHVGEDSGWELAGLPIHSITAGVVVMIMYEPTWGHLVALETRTSRDSIYNHYYGHLSGNIDVRVGQKIRCGQKIGELGPTWSLMIGGYRTHLHLGIARGRNRESGTKGYYSHTRLWYNPVSFLYARVKEETASSSEQFLNDPGNLN
ncbi:MAG: peptidoglycan DD-metalloendopeptidase family protein [Chitinispirillaceae bacterium]